MKKIHFLFVVLIVLGGLMLSSCEEIEAGIGTIQLVNNSSTRIVYWTAEKGGRTIGEARVNVFPGNSATATIDSGVSYTVYLENEYGDGWVTRNTFTVRKDETTVLRFPADFKVSN